MLNDVRRSPLLPALLSIAYIVTPASGWGLLEGRPLDFLSTAALAAVCWLWARPYRDRRAQATAATVLAVAFILKILLGMTLVPRGFEARYYANARFDGPIERSTEPADATFTRVDRRLRFGFEGAPDAPVAFFNEIRFNYFHEHDPKREGLPFSVMWQGLWRVTASGKQQIYVRSPGGTVDVAIGDVLAERIDATDEWTGQVDLPAGLHRVMISWSVPQGGARRFAAGRIVDGGEEPFDERVIVRRRAGGAAFVSDRLVRAASTVLDALLLAALLMQSVRQTARSWRNLGLAYDAADAIALAWMFGVLDALVFAVPAVGRMVTLSGGDDWLLYESYARDIVLNGPLMTLGEPLGRGTPFSAQPLYAYFLAACHWLSGDGLFGIYFVQRLLVAATVIALWRATALVFCERVGLAALVTGIVVAYQKLAGWSGVLLAEVMFTSLFAWWSYVLIRLARTASEPARSSPTPWMAVWAGVIGGLATLARSSVPTGWVLALPLVAFAIPRNRHRMTVLALIMSTMIAVCSLATIRNWIVAHKLVLITAQGPQGLFLGNPPPPLDTPPAYRAWYDRFDVDPLVEKVIEFARQQPLQFTAGLARKAKYTLGWFGTMLEGAPTSRFYIAVWMLALAGVVLTPWMRPVSLPLALVPFALAASHFVATVIIMPQVYVDRAIVPFYLLLVPSAALPIAAAARWVGAASYGRLAAVICTLLLGAAVLKILTWFPAVDFDVLAAGLLTACVCMAGLPSGRSWPLVVSATYMVAMAIWFVRSPTSESAALLRMGSLFVATAVVSATSLKDARGFRVAIGWTSFTVAAIGAAVLLRLGFPTDVIAQFAQSLRHAFGYLSSYAAAAGFVLCLGALIARTSHPRLQRALIYAAGAALMVPALHWAGAMITPGRALLQREMAAFGALTVAAYVAIWIDAAWPAGRDLSARACEGLALGMFVTILFGTVIGHAGAAPTVAAGLLIGVIQAERSAARPVRTG